MNLLELAVKVVADDQVSGKLGGIASKAKGFAGNIAKAGAAIGAATLAAGAAIGAMGKAALDSYAEYEQLAGGVEKLYGKSADLLMDYADKAYMTAGMSANQYMEQATSFSAALIGSLGGDTEAAAKQTDVAMRAMSDNVNVFGSNMEDVQHAFQGFAKQNYTMLDNLKLGYGGTKSEMERLIADANEYAASIGQASDLSIDSFSDVVSAIELVQEKQGIAGTTAKEAATTIEGSIAMVQASWQNLLTEFGKDDGDVGARVGELVESAKTALLGHVDEATGEVQGGIIPRFKVIMTSIAEALPSVLPSVMEALGQVVSSIGEALMQVAPTILGAILELIPQGIEAAIQGFSAIGTALAENGPQILEQIGSVLSSLVDAVIENAPAMLEAAGNMIMSLGTAIVQNLPNILRKLLELITSMVTFLITHIPDILAGAVQLIGGLIMGIAESIPDIIAAVGEILTAIIETIGGFFADLFQAGAELLGKLGEGISSAAGQALSAIQGVGNNILTFLGSIPGRIVNFFQGIPSQIGNIFGRMRDGAKQAFNGLVNFVRDIPNKIMGFFSGIGTWLIDSGKALINGFLDGIKNAFAGAKKFVEDGLDGLRRLFPFSPAKEGPFSGKGWTLYSGMSVMDAMAEGIAARTGNAVYAARSAMGKMSSALKAQGGYQLAYDGGFGAVPTAQGDTYYITLQVEDPHDYNGMAMAFTEAVQARNAMRGRAVADASVRRL